MTTKLNLTITSNEDHLIVETRIKGRPDTKAIPRDNDLAQNLLVHIEAVIEASKPPVRPAPAPAPEKPETSAKPGT